MIFERKPLDISVTDTNTRKLLRLSYQEIGPFVNYRETGKPDAKISFRIEQNSAPSLTLTYCVIPQSTQASAANLMMGLARF